MKRLLSIILLVLGLQFTNARSQVDTITVQASKMNKTIRNVVVLPNDYSKRKHYPLVVLLHGYSDNYAKWVNIVPEIKQLATLHQCILVCPDGAKSWYMDSPIDPNSQYESYIVTDLINYMDSHYSTLATPKSRAITGLSMGGHGALYLAIRHKDVFANAGSMSGGVDLRSFSKQFDVAKLIGSYESKPEEWDNRSVVNMVTTLKNKELNLIIDCGMDDFFYQINAALHRRLLSLKIDHDYIERPGIHNWIYWKNAIHYQLLYFRRCFDKN